MFNEDAPPPRRPRLARDIIPQVPLPATNPLDDQVADGTVTGDIENDDRVEAGVISQKLNKADKMIKRVTKAGYYTCVIFPDEDTCYQFLRKSGWDQHAECFGAYVDGLEVAKMLGIELEIDPIWFRDRKVDRRLVDEVGCYSPEEEPDRVEKTGGDQ